MINVMTLSYHVMYNEGVGSKGSRTVDFALEFVLLIDPEVRDLHF
jgi:hypothetical protein